MAFRVKVSVCLIVFLSLSTAQGVFNYKDALEKSILLFEGQRSGKLPPDQRISWRGNSGLSDGSLANVSLTIGLYSSSKLFFYKFI